MVKVCGKSFWANTTRAGLTVTFWADQGMLHLLVAGAQIKSFRSHLSRTDLAALVEQGARPAGPSPLPPAEPDVTAIEVDRLVNRFGSINLAGRQLLAAEILAGRQVSIRIARTNLLIFDPENRELLRVRPHPFTWDDVLALRGARPAGPPPRPRTEPVTVQRRANSVGVIMVALQKLMLGRAQAGREVTIHVAEHTMTVELDDTSTRTFQRTTTNPVRRWRAQRPASSTTNVS